MAAAKAGWESGNWPPQKPAWTAEVGEGSTSPVVMDGRLYTMGWQDGLVCLDATSGRQLWSVSYECPRHGRQSTGDQGLYSGPTSTPEYDLETGYLYTLSVDGDLNCWDTSAKGRKLWGLNLYEQYNVPQRPKVGRSGRRDYGYTSSPLICDDWVIVEVGASAGNLVTFDKRTGQQRWTSEAKDPAGHTGGPVPIEIEGTPCLASRKQLGRSDAWPHVVLADGRLYCKDATGYLLCFELH